MPKAKQIFGETAEAEYADVFILGRTSAKIGPFERLRNLTYTRCGRQILLLRNLITGR